MDVPPGKQIAAVFDCRSAASAAILQTGSRYIRALARVGEISCGVGIDRPEKAATQVAGDVEILLPLAGLIDVDAEVTRLAKEIAKVEKDVELFEKKLGNEAFVAKAPPQVLEKDRGKLAEAREKLGILLQSQQKIQSLK
jgi:valyl-tRNA synthetase